MDTTKLPKDGIGRHIDRKEGLLILSSLEEELKKPYVARHIVDYLSSTFDMDYLISTKPELNAEQRVGRMMGVQEIIRHLEMLAAEGEEGY